MHEKYSPTCKTATDTKQCVQDLKFKGFTKKDLFLELTESFPVLYFLKQNFISIEHWNGWKQGSVFCFLFLFFLTAWLHLQFWRYKVEICWWTSLLKAELSKFLQHHPYHLATHLGPSLLCLDHGNNQLVLSSDCEFELFSVQKNKTHSYYKHLSFVQNPVVTSFSLIE